MTSRIGIIALISVVGITGCATARPVLYPNEHYRAVGQAAAEQDIAECRRMAEAAGAGSPRSGAGRTARSTLGGAAVGAATGAVGGAVAGSPGTGSAIGAASGATAGLLHSIFGGRGPNPAYVAFVNRCLMEREYDVVGWD